ncbi:hypothetical protein HDV02_006762, partial [Globomyces sp. JEL0801]
MTSIHSIKAINKLANLIMDMHSNSIWVTDVLHLLQKVIKCQQLPLEKLAENLKKYADLYDSEPLRTCLDAHHEESLPEANYFIGMCYLYGKGVDQDIGEAKKYLELAWKNAQLPIAIYELGKLHDVLGYQSIAFRNFLLAANLGVTKAYGKLATIYECGDVIYDLEEAKYWN